LNAALGERSNGESRDAEEYGEEAHAD